MKSITRFPFRNFGIFFFRRGWRGNPPVFFCCCLVFREPRIRRHVFFLVDCVVPAPENTRAALAAYPLLIEHKRRFHKATILLYDTS